MNQRENLILHNGQDITADVKFCQYNPTYKMYDITFQSDKIYQYNYNSIEWIRKPELIDPTLVHITHGDRELFNIENIFSFRGAVTDYWHVCFSNGSERTYDKRELKIATSCLSKKKSQDCLDYLRELASINELKSDDGEVLLQKQYDSLDFVGSDSTMALYLNPNDNKIRTYQKRSLIFPFGGNASQFRAVENAMCNQLSVIQGPPGTGKTQTILNIIANLLVENKSIQVVSNNNSATANILEKLASPKYGMEFLVAPLGSSNNKKQFIQNQNGRYPDLSSWEMEPGEQEELREKIKGLSEEVSNTFKKQERLAQTRLELESLLLEIKYFEQYCSESELPYADIKLRRTLKSEKLMQLWQECYAFSEKKHSVSFLFKIKSALIYGISDWNFYKNSLPTIITLLQALFYQARRKELASEIHDLKEYLDDVEATRKMDKLTRWSLDYLHAKLFEKYGNKHTRKYFTGDDLWKRAIDIPKEYPIILSTTFSSRNCLKGVTYNYVIMDEASQVDIATGALALSSAKNAVIVGDLKQLPNVVAEDAKKRSDSVFNSYKLAAGYSFSANSFLKSICCILPEAPQTLLREHYRCHPKIIGYCNQKFYHNELIVMTTDHGEDDTLSVYKTVEGNHRRDHTNQRQIDVLIQEALPKLKSNVTADEIGVIAPYRDQATNITTQLDSNLIEVDTVHKFQGREKDTIVLTTVDDVVTDFSDDPYLLNVAVSRAKKRLCLVTSCNEQPTDSNIGDLISYIEYYNFQIVQSEIYSVFDLLYRQYTDARIAFLKKHPRVSTYDSENVMYGNLMELLKRHTNLPLNVICHQPLNMLIRDPKRLNDEECRYAMNTATHLDFLIYSTISKKPVLAIEVDGFHYHKRGTAQYERDRMKDRILKLYGIPLLRFPTNGSGEIEQVAHFLNEYEKLI
ncbi:superfamily I DNA and/or RNA helicase [Hydrogenoanaerobacterium saccharovorans]|uniref:Superfamily I DNA and/or RNA helicase n=1 Tax=Hydrogenoanaerobacterium saccharovorans TaxID=474960 RepID=A0A1H8E5J7_9FIRM|nr:AAA domain-containing protein [Hydrogenoanaerobacterium saccharovorans]RPF41983.1 superfamily I DNA and/or RNA helicase [Hydrogenoanaerobacterium saccharovorans]SEN14839.1 Superfamily I DNA and/or RNA helicase [Hydrogenoanaerobacterium saccharovorans]